MKWLDIKTAPRDGTEFIAKNGSVIGRTKIGKYYVKWPHEPGGPTFREGWDRWDHDSIMPWSPTHWIPMPAME